MQAKILLYKTSNNDIVVLEAECEMDLIDEYGRDFGQWPYDLKAYDKEVGLILWEGYIPEMEDIPWKGEFRKDTIWH